VALLCAVPLAGSRWPMTSHSTRPGVAFHEGTLQRRSAGCVRLTMEDAQRFYTYLQLGDKVQIAA